MKPQPLIAVADVPASSAWYQSVLGLVSKHGGPDYDQLFHADEMVLQLHHQDAHDHPHLGNPNTDAGGQGVLLWFQDDAIDTAYRRATAAGAEVLEPMKINLNANHREFWIRDPDGYVIVVAGRYGDV